MSGLRCRFGSVLLAVGLCVAAQSSSAVPIIDEIDIPALGVVYDSVTGNFVVAGLASNIVVQYNNGQPIDLVPNIEFLLSANALDSVVSAGGSVIDYTSSGPTGTIRLNDAGFNLLLVGDLVSLHMEIVDPFAGLFEGSGDFEVTAGSLSEAFGASGGIATIGLSFEIPLTFNSPFGALASTKLLPTEAPAASPIPEPNAAVAFVFGLTVVARSFARKRGRAS